MSRDNSIDPRVLNTLLKKFSGGGPYTEDPNSGAIDLGGGNQSALLFGLQSQFENPMGQPGDQILLGDQNFGAPQDNRALFYDWENNPEGHDSFLSSILEKDNPTRLEKKYLRENWATSTLPNLQDPRNPVNSNKGTDLFDNNTGTGSTPPSEKGAEGTISQDGEWSTKDGVWTRISQSKDDPNTSVDDKGRLVGGSDNVESEEEREKRLRTAMMMSGFASPGGLDMESTLFKLGQGIGMQKGTKGRGALIGLSAADALIKGGRNLFSGIGVGNVNAETERWMQDQMLKRRYVADSQSRDANYTGGYSFSKDGGTIGGNVLKKYFNGGGPGDPPKEKTAEELELEAKMEAQQQRYMERVGQISRINRKRFDAINAGFDPITGKTVKLAPEGSDLRAEQDAYAFIKQNSESSSLDRDARYEHWAKGQRKQVSDLEPLITPSFEDGGNMSKDQALAAILRGTPQQEPNGTESYKVGQHVEFEYGGKRVAGKIKKIDTETGQIFI
jgi:hypothetical protein